MIVDYQFVVCRFCGSPIRQGPGSITWHLQSCCFFQWWCDR